MDQPPKKAKFFDMVQSNNGARVRLWVRHCSLGVSDHIETQIVKKVVDLQSPEFAEINPFQKIPALIRDDGHPIFEAAVILNYLEDKFHHNLRFVPATPEDRQEMNLLIQLHDMYVASPNCTAPGFSHSQGAMYLTPVPVPDFCPARRIMPDPAVRAAKIAELWKQLELLDRAIARRGGPYIMGDQLTLVDFTWFPTTVYMEFMLPKIFGWKNIFREPDVLPDLSRWWTNLADNQTEFATVRKEIGDFWEEAEAKGAFDTIKEVVQDKTYQWTYPVQWQGPFPAMLPDQPDPTETKIVEQPKTEPDEQVTLIDRLKLQPVVMHDARQLDPPASLTTHGFTLQAHPSVMASTEDFEDEDLVRNEYYPEVRDLVRKLTGATQVGVFGHTLRTSTATSCTEDFSTGTGPVAHAHCDYTENSAPRLLQYLAESGQLLMVQNEPVDQSFVKDMLLEGKGTAFINVWRSIDDKNPVLCDPVALCDARSVSVADRITCATSFPHGRGERYSLRHNDAHQWYMYPRMQFYESLVFKVFDTQEPKFVFHTSFTDPRGGFLPPPRKSIEVRTAVFFDGVTTPDMNDLPSHS